MASVVKEAATRNRAAANLGCWPSQKCANASECALASNVEGDLRSRDEVCMEKRDMLKVDQL